VGAGGIARLGNGLGAPGCVVPVPLLPLPGFLTGGAAPDAAAWRDALRLTGHFLARDAFGHQHRPLPQVRAMLYDRVVAMSQEPNNDAG